MLLLECTKGQMKELDKIFFPFLVDCKIEEENTFPAYTQVAGVLCF